MYCNIHKVRQTLNGKTTKLKSWNQFVWMIGLFGLIHCKTDFKNNYQSIHYAKTQYYQVVTTKFKQFDIT